MSFLITSFIQGTVSCFVHTNCMKQMQEDPQQGIEPNVQFPFLANVAGVQKSANGYYSIVAKTDIDVGCIIAIEELFQKYPIGKFGSTCNICVKKYGNLMACKICADAMFCPECQGDSLHECECDLNFCGENELNSITMATVRCILQMLKAFPNRGVAMNT